MINNNQATAEIKKKRIEISILSNKMEISKEELKIIREKLCKVEDSKNDLNHKGMASLSKMQKEIIQEEKKKVWENQKLHETTKEVKNYKARKKK